MKKICLPHLLLLRALVVPFVIKAMENRFLRTLKNRKHTLNRGYLAVILCRNYGD